MPTFTEVDEKLAPKTKQKRPRTKKKEVDEFSCKLDLPSGFSPYDFKELYVRPLTVLEVKKLQPIINGKATGISLANAISGAASMRLDQLTFGDFWFVSAWLRLNTFPNAPFGMKWTCPKCGRANVTNLDLASLDIVELAEEYKEPATVTLPNGEKVPLRLNRVEHQDLVEDFAKALHKTDSPTEEEMFIPSLAITVANGQSLFSNVELLSSDKYTPEDLNIIASFQDTFSHGLPRYTSATCGGEGGCDSNVNRLRLDFRIHDIVPVNGYRGYLRDNIQFG